MKRRDTANHHDSSAPTSGFCTTCQVEHGPCSVCFNDLSTVRLCRQCKDDPANQGWSDERLDGDFEDEEQVDLRHHACDDLRRRIADLHDRKLRKPHPRTMTILLLVIYHQIRVPYRPRGKARSWREVEWKKRPLHLAEIAHLVGVSRAAVSKTLCRYEPLMTSLAQRPPPLAGEGR